jgi:photosystem II stability/assembly factor-like uncharacterized protein
MKKAIFILVVFLIVLSNEIVSQEGWFWQNPLPNGNNLNDIKVVTDLGIAVGEGTILANNGNGWQPTDAGNANNFFSVSISGNTAWAVGLDGIIMRSSDGAGTSWEVQSSGVDKQLRSVFFLNENLGWCVGLSETVLRTANGGNDWEIIDTDGSQHYSEVIFLDENNGWLVGSTGNYGVIKNTTDGGTTWTRSLLPTSQMKSIHFADANFGCAVGNGGKIFRTTDGGSSWSLAVSNTSKNLKGVYLDNSGGGWAVGDDGTIITTTDSAANWSPQTSGTSKHLNSIDGEWIVGWACRILHTTDAGATWELDCSKFAENLLDIEFVTENIGYAVGEGGRILRTIDGGITWDSLQSGTTETLYAVEFINADTGWIAGRDNDGSNSSATRLIQRTMDGGLNWEFQHLPGGGGGLVMDVNFIEGAPGEPMRGFCTGGLSYTWRTDDYGETWERLSGGCGNGNFNSCCFVDENTGWFVGTPSNVGTGYSIMRTIDGGETFEEQLNPTDIRLSSVCFADNQKGLAVGNNGTIIYTSDGGANWEVSPDGGYTTWQSVSLTETGKAWAVDTKGGIAYSSDWGHTWEAQESGTPNTLMEVLFIDDSEGWIVGYNGIILHTTNGGITTGVSEENTNIIKEFSLEQNYPNPFNPSTTISYSITKKSNVVLKVFDVLGRQVTVLVNEGQLQGNYEVEFDASNLTSGIYFYRIQTGDFVESKKMVLIK